jgi:type II secretory pathway pseudopilin PulG
MIEVEMDGQAITLERQQRRNSEAGFTLIDVLFVVAMIGIICSIAIPRLMRSRAVANEATTIASLKATHTAQLAYSITCGAGFYAASFPVLGVGGALAVPFLPEDLTASATPFKSNYNYTMGAGINGVVGPLDCNGTATISAYYISAVPDDPDNGTRGFATNQDQAIWQDATGVAPTEPFAQAGTVAALQ